MASSDWHKMMWNCQTLMWKFHFSSSGGPLCRIWPSHMIQFQKGQTHLVTLWSKNSYKINSKHSKGLGFHMMVWHIILSSKLQQKKRWRVVCRIQSYRSFFTAPFQHSACANIPFQHGYNSVCRINDCIVM